MLGSPTTSESVLRYTELKMRRHQSGGTWSSRFGTGPRGRTAGEGGFGLFPFFCPLSCSVIRVSRRLQASQIRRAKPARTRTAGALSSVRWGVQSARQHQRILAGARRAGSENKHRGEIVQPHRSAWERNEGALPGATKQVGNRVPTDLLCQAGVVLPKRSCRLPNRLFEDYMCPCGASMGSLRRNGGYSGYGWGNHGAGRQRGSRRRSPPRVLAQVLK